MKSQVLFRDFHFNLPCLCAVVFCVCRTSLCRLKAIPFHHNQIQLLNVSAQEKMLSFSSSSHIVHTSSIHLSSQSHLSNQPTFFPFFFYVENLNCHFYLMKDVISFLATLLWNTCLTLGISVVLYCNRKDIKNVG